MLFGLPTCPPLLCSPSMPSVSATRNLSYSVPSTKTQESNPEFGMIPASSSTPLPITSSTQSPTAIMESFEPSTFRFTWPRWEVVKFSCLTEIANRAPWQSTLQSSSKNLNMLVTSAMYDLGHIFFTVEQCFSTWVPRNQEVPPKYYWVPPHKIQTKHSNFKVNNLLRYFK